MHDFLLKRLDDSQDSIRIEVCEALKVFFKLLKADFKMETYEKIVRTLFLHYDDPSTNIRQSVEAVLKVAAKVHSQEVLNIVLLCYLMLIG